MHPDNTAIILVDAADTESTRVRFRVGHSQVASQALLCSDCRDRLLTRQPDAGDHPDITYRTLEAATVPPLPKLFRGLSGHPDLLAALFGGNEPSVDRPLTGNLTVRPTNRPRDREQRDN